MSVAEPPARRRTWIYGGIVLVSAAATAGGMYLWDNISTRKWEARETVYRVVDIPPGTVDPAEWGKNYPRQYDSYKRTVDLERTHRRGN